MALLKREEWQGFVRDVDWTYSYVDDEAVYPEWHSGTGKVPREAWAAWEESYKISYPEYVAVQREKEASAYAVKAALQRSTAFDHLDEGWKSATKMHFGGVALVEYAAVLAELKMARFGLNGAWRNMATFGQLDEMRHAQITTFFGHEFIGKDAAVRLDAEDVPHQRLGADLAAQPVRRDDELGERGGHRHRAAADLRDRVHQPAVRRARRRRSRGRGRQLRQHDLLDPDRRGAPLPAGGPDAGDPGRARPGPRPVGDRQELLGLGPRVRRADRPRDGLLHAAGAP